MTSALWRGSNLPDSVPKFMAIPEGRHDVFLRKYKSPLFAEHFQKDNWKLIYFEAIRQSYSKKGKRLELATLVDAPAPRVRQKAQGEQIALF
jgi:hypothetical protein